MLQGEHSAILSTFIKLAFVIKIFVLSIFEWPFYTGFTLHLLWDLILYSVLALLSSEACIGFFRDTRYLPFYF